MTKESQSAFDIVCGRRLALVREALGLSQETLGAALGISRQGVSNYENGIRKLNPEFVIRLYGRYRITTDYIYRGDTYGLPNDLANILAPELAKLAG